MVVVLLASVLEAQTVGGPEGGLLRRIEPVRGRGMVRVIVPSASGGRASSLKHLDPRWEFAVAGASAVARLLPVLLVFCTHRPLRLP